MRALRIEEKDINGLRNTSNSWKKYGISTMKSSHIKNVYEIKNKI
jgi:hypothetical protein